MTRDDFGVWSVHLPAVNGQSVIPHNTKVKVNSILENKGLNLDHHDYPTRRAYRQTPGLDQTCHPGSVLFSGVRRNILESSTEICLQEQTSPPSTVRQSLRGAWSVTLSHLSL